MNDPVLAALLHSQLWAVLAHGFAEPTPVLAEWQEQTAPVEEFAALVQALPGGVELSAPLRELHVARTGINNERALQELRDAHADLFVNLRSEGSVPPYETEYTGGANDFLKNQDLADLMGFYRAFGLDLHDGEQLRERPDHLAAELEFLHFLRWKEARARVEENEEHAAVCLDALRHFLRDHLGRWAEVFSRGVEKASRQGFFRALAVLLRAVVAHEAASLEVTLDPVRVPLPCRGPEPEPLTCGANGECPLQRMS